MAGRKSLGLTKEEKAIRKELLRKAREKVRREAERRAILSSLVERIEAMELTKTTDEIVAELMKDESLVIKVKSTPALAGYNGGRLKRG